MSIATYTPLTWWLDASDEWVATAVDLLNEIAEGGD